MATEQLPTTFTDYARDRQSPRFTDWLRDRTGSSWSEATRHRFVEELGNDTLDDDVFRTYLIQDYAFLQTVASVTGYAAGQAYTMEEKSTLTNALAVLTGGENDYFQRSFDALDVPESDRTDPPLTATTREFQDLLLRGALEGGYEETLSVILAAEWIYLDWATYVEDRSPERFYFEEWIDLHANPEFAEYVSWLRDQVNEYGPALSPRRQARLDRLFRRTVDLEVAFFDAAYDGPAGGADH